MAKQFIAQYRQQLREEMEDAGLPEEIRESYEFDSCLDLKPHQEIYKVRRRTDNQLGLLRISKGERRGDAAAEKAILSDLFHPAIPRLLDYREDGERGYLVREYFEGWPLSLVVRNRGPMPQERVLDMGERLCDILCYTHRRVPPVIHRDIKPENIVLSQDGSVKLIDFGIARQYRWSEKQDTQVFGTAQFAPPEQFGYGQTGTYSDVYSLGMVLLFLATGGLDKLNIKKTIPHQGLREVIEKATAFAPDARYPNGVEMKAAIGRARRWRFYDTLKTAKKVAAAIGAAAAAAFLILLGWFLVEEFISPTVDIEDDLVAMAARDSIGIEAGDDITRFDMDNLVNQLSVFGNVSAPADIENGVNQDNEYVYYAGDYEITTRGDISSLEDLREMRSLREVSLVFQEITDLSPISGLRLSYLDIDNNFVSDLSPLEEMISLRTLFISSNPIRDLSPISGLVRLQALDLSLTEVTDLSPLSGMGELETLVLRYMPVEEVEVIHSLTALSGLTIQGLTITDYTPIFQHRGFQELDVSYTNIKTPFALEDVSRLESLGVAGLGLMSLEGVEKMGNLKELRVQENPLLSLSGVEALSKLDTLMIQYTAISDISPLADLYNLTYIDLGYTQVEDVTPLLGRTEPLTVVCPGLPQAAINALYRDGNITVIE